MVSIHACGCTIAHLLQLVCPPTRPIRYRHNALRGSRCCCRCAVLSESPLDSCVAVSVGRAVVPCPRVPHALSGPRVIFVALPVIGVSMARFRPKARDLSRGDAGLIEVRRVPKLFLMSDEIGSSIAQRRCSCQVP